MPLKDPTARKEYYKQYRENHKVWFENYRRKYYRSNKAKLDAKYKEWYEKNKTEAIERGKKRYAKHKGKILAYLKEYIKRPGMREKHNLRIREYKKRDRMLCLGHYSNGKMECACCGENQYEFLTINHIKGGGRQHKRNEQYSHIDRWLMSQNFPEGYNVLCWNCNACLGINGFCPHQKC